MSLFRRLIISSVITSATIASIPFAFPSLAWSQSQDDKVREIVTKVATAWEAARMERDSAAMTQLYTQDAIVLPSGGTVPLRGQAQIQALWDNMYKEGVKPLKVDVSSARRIAPNVITVTGTWSEKISEQTNLRGLFMYNLVQDGDDWKYQTMIWNTQR